MNWSCLTRERSPRNDPEEQILKPGDVVTIYSQNDVGVPKALKDNLVTLRGEFANPGVYKVRPGETLTSLVGQSVVLLRRLCICERIYPWFGEA